MTWLAVAVGAAVGAVCRHLLDGAVRRRRPGPFPSGVLAVNLLGCLLAGVVAGAAPGPPATALLSVGLLGGFTTASTLAVDVLRLVDGGHVRAAVLDVVLSLGPGLVLAVAGMVLGRLMA